MLQFILIVNIRVTDADTRHLNTVILVVSNIMHCWYFVTNISHTAKIERNVVL